MPSTEDNTAREIAAEQAYLDTLYVYLDEMRVDAAAQLADLRIRPTANTPAAVSEREAFVRQFASRVSQLDAVEQRLAFGRLDLTDSERRYIGRIGISDEARNQLLVDWRAPAAEPFYQATAAAPQDVVRRRSLTTSGRRITGVQDEVLDLETFDTDGVAGGKVVVGEGALFASLDVARSGRMRDIVATIQADQDRAIRAPLAGVLVVQGGPGTGKTAVALHRAAFLLYANRARIERSGVLVVGPNRVFLRYIEQVLPALGEAEAVLMRTPAELYPGIVANGRETPETAALKGDLRMADVIREAVRRRQRPLERQRILDVEGTKLRLRPVDVQQARDKARRSGKRHNQARTTFVKEILRILVRQLASARGTALDTDSRDTLMGELFESVDVRREINWCWAPIRAERLLRDLFAQPERLAEVGRRLTKDERALLARERTALWTVADIALLDETAELLGPDETSNAPEKARAKAERRAEAEYAESVQDAFGGGDFISAKDLAERYAETGSLGSVAERAAADREWTFGHVVVDEAQELSPMMWRVLMRRSPSRSMTIVGDTAQTGALAGATSWSEVLTPLVADRWQLVELTVNYRTPGQIMDVAAAVVKEAGLPVSVPTSAREGRHSPEYTLVPDLGSATVADVVRSEWEQADPGTVVVITSRASHALVAANIAAALPRGVVTADTEALGSPVSVLIVADAKGLEFDTVVLVEPSEILAESPRGVNDLYVALTRPTQRLHVVQTRAGAVPGLD
ncbi:MAG: ATP-dependent helicase [Pseudonocardiales bacterium]|nr:ATP-dependent helicase [Pseudonocardiales bacterium]